MKSVCMHMNMHKSKTLIHEKTPGDATSVILSVLCLISFQLLFWFWNGLKKQTTNTNKTELVCNNPHPSCPHCSPIGVQKAHYS